jgi:DNA-binding NtrC family response regulator
MTGKKALVIADDKRLSKVIQRLLGHNQFQVEMFVADKPSEISQISWAGNERFDIMIVAVSLDNNDPIAWLKACPAMDSVRDAPWLVISNRPFADDPDRQIAHLHFPFDIIEFWLKVEELLEPGSDGIGLLRFLGGEGDIKKHHRNSEKSELGAPILLASSNDTFRRELGQLLENQDGMTIMAQARTGLEAGIKALTMFPDIVIIDENIPMFHSKIVDWIREKVPPITVVLLSMMGDIDSPPMTTKIADKLYTLKGVNQTQLVEAVRNILTGETIQPCIVKQS